MLRTWRALSQDCSDLPCHIPFMLSTSSLFLSLLPYIAFRRAFCFGLYRECANHSELHCGSSRWFPRKEHSTWQSSLAAANYHLCCRWCDPACSCIRWAIMYTSRPWSGAHRVWKLEREVEPSHNYVLLVITAVLPLSLPCMINAPLRIMLRCRWQIAAVAAVSIVILFSSNALRTCFQFPCMF